jgi:hypothetical protein
MQALGEEDARKQTELPTPDAPLEMSRSGFLKGAAGALVATTVLLGTPTWLQGPAFAATRQAVTTGTAAQRNRARSIVRNSTSFKNLASKQQQIGAAFDFTKAEFRFRNRLGVVHVGSASKKRGVLAIFFMDMRYGKVFRHDHQFWIPNSSSGNTIRADVLSYSLGKPKEKYHHVLIDLKARDRSDSSRAVSSSSRKEFYAGYAITEDGRRRTLQRFSTDLKEENARRRQRLQSTRSSTSSRSDACADCRSTAELLCNDATEVLCYGGGIVGGALGGAATGAVVGALGGPIGAGGGAIVGGIGGAIGGIGCGIYMNHVNAAGSGCASYPDSYSINGCADECGVGTGDSSGSGTCDP